MIPNLVTDIFYLIFTISDNNSLKNIKQVCKTWYKISSNIIQKRTKQILSNYEQPLFLTKKNYSQFIDNLVFLNSENFYLFDFLDTTQHSIVAKTILVKLIVLEIKTFMFEIKTKMLLQKLYILYRSVL